MNAMKTYESSNLTAKMNKQEIRKQRVKSNAVKVHI